MFAPISLWEAKSLLSSLSVSFVFLLRRLWFWKRRQGSFQIVLVISKLKPRNHSSQIMCPPLTGYLGCPLTRVEEAGKKTLLLSGFHPSAFHRCQSCQYCYACSQTEFCCEKTGVFLLLSHMSLGQMDKVNAQMHSQLWKQVKTVFKCIINHIFL